MPSESLSDHSATSPDVRVPEAPTLDATIKTGVETLTRIALEADDPVTALDEGADALAEALATRDLSERSRARAARERAGDEAEAYRHARQHRLSELMDQGYGFDHAIAITDNNEAEIRSRAIAMGIDPMQAIYNYAVYHGFRSQAGAGANDPISAPSTMERLAALDEAAFEKATSGDAWRRLMDGS